jgi:predicted O-methyltransferase YrrM
MKFDSNTENILKELEQLQQEGIYPNIDRLTAEYIFDLIIQNKPKYIIEVGAANGYSTLWLGLAAKEVGGRVVTFERGPDRFKVLVENIERTGLTRFITARNVDANLGLAELSPVIDFAFIDATKAEYLKYFQIMEPKFLTGAVIVADNIISHQVKLQNFIDYVKINADYESEILEIGKGIMIIKKR